MLDMSTKRVYPRSIGRSLAGRLAVRCCTGQRLHPSSANCKVSSHTSTVSKRKKRVGDDASAERRSRSSTCQNFSDDDRGRRTIFGNDNPCAVRSHDYRSLRNARPHWRTTRPPGRPVASAQPLPFPAATSG
uniref:M108 protein n=1 Tax=Steinernema glaseri TaxID=37863 RepID=A0A1I7ZSP3_9BILA